MFKIINELIKKNNSTIPSDDIYFNIRYNPETSSSTIDLNISIKDPSKEDFLYQAEHFAVFIFNVCGDNPYLINPTLAALNKLKKQSTTHLLFVNNVFYVWDKLIEQTIKTDTKPLVRPSKVFKQINNEIF